MNRTISSARELAVKEVASIGHHVRTQLENNDDFNGLTIDRVFHYVISGTHVDPDLGVNYVPLKEPVSDYRHRKINARKRKVMELCNWMIETLRAGTSPESVQNDIEVRQKFPAVILFLL